MAKDSRRMSASEEQFGAWVQEAIAHLPAPYDAIVRDVSVVVEDEPPLDVLEELELESEDDLLGLYQGLSLHERSFFQPGGELPARIAIYRGPILRLCRTKTEVIQEIRDTVVHELGHHVGLSDDEMPY